MLERLVPNFVACAETREDRLDTDLLPRLAEFRGRWVVEDDVICTAVVVAARDRAGPGRTRG